MIEHSLNGCGHKVVSPHNWVDPPSIEARRGHARPSYLIIGVTDWPGNCAFFAPALVSG